ncbi:glycosyltransferase [Microbacterium kyungheense]|uniref:Glycosyl transferase family 2 n=1 Tax=Microbacterium kyungheense TaxID=1263636 RepID=A0A543ERS8_9MICO|nr:glycosyltransferase family A protein [Microbacterium kyungheense]TQM24286.1 glycosyl transferase family 2 [Microbacterium kyungheense]
MATRPRPAVSVVIPAYNAAEFLGEQLEALARQDAGFMFEVLVCDNGSSDDTAAVARAFSERMPHLRQVDASARRGASAARNLGAQAASASLLLFCDADDVVDPSWVRTLHDALGRASFVAGAVEHKLLNPGREWDFGWDRPTFHDPALPELPACGSGNMGVHADVFAEVGGFDESLNAGEDIDFAWRVQLAGHPLIDEPAAIVHYRKRGGLRAAARQGRAKGVGTRVLAHRYALVRAAYAEQVSLPQDPDRSTAGDGGRSEGRWDRLRRLPRKAGEIVRNPAAITPYVAGIAFRLGYRTAPLDDVDRVPVPDRLPRA